jgi:hypothetical protein
MSFSKCLLIGAVLLIIQRMAFDAYFFLGLSSSLPPLDVEGSSVFILPTVADTNITRFNRKQRQKRQEKTYRSSSITFFEDTTSNKTKLAPTWHLHGSDENMQTEQLNVNSCFRKGLSFHCLPAVYIVGFEKCGTTVLNIWLSYHPNLKTNWAETRFFDKVRLNLTNAWHDYLPQLPSLEESDLGKVWTFEKSPAYSTNPSAARSMADLVPDARILFLTRNPTQRAYSMFLMYTHHYMDFTQAMFGNPMSLFVRNNRTNAVHYVKDYKLRKVPPGVGGTVVDPKQLNNLTQGDTWVYLNYPPTPHEFHKFVNRAIKIIKGRGLETQILDQTRGNRVLTGGLYGDFLEKIWLQNFEPHQLILVPSEDFFENSKVLDNVKTLQELLGLPVFDYSEIASNITGRMEIPASLGTVLNQKFNANVKGTLPMLSKTKKLLDDFYCESNRKLRELLGGRALPKGYACGGDDEETAEK